MDKAYESKYGTLNLVNLPFHVTNNEKKKTRTNIGFFTSLYLTSFFYRSSSTNSTNSRN